MPSVTSTQNHPSPPNCNQNQTEATMIQGGNVNIGYANLNMTNQQINEATHERRYALDLLRSNCSLAALVDANERYNPPRCADETRRNIIRRMEDWVRHNSTSSSIFWLYGGAGAGKSALAQTLAEKLKTTGELAASFFFFKTDMKRNDGNRLISTLVYQLVQSYQGLALIVEEKILQNPDLFQKKRQTQMSELLIEPLIRLSLQNADSGEQSNTVLKSHPQLVVIDGLDECGDPEIQCDLLQIIANAIPRLPYPLRFLITSRPESHISRVFEHDLSKAVQHNLSDDLDSTKDIRYFLDGEFAETRRTHPLRRYLPSTWPPLDAINSIVERSSGHFIYASTVIRFIRSPHHRPDDRLQVILGIKQPNEKDQPYAPLDSLYSYIFLQIQDPDQLEKVYRAFGIIHLRTLKCSPLFDSSYWSPSRWSSNLAAIEALLELRPGDLILLFDRLRSLVTFEKDDIRIFHKSLFDYLLDSSRSGDLQLDLGLAHETVADYILKRKNIQGNWVSAWALETFMYHCQFGKLNKVLMGHLRSLAYDPEVSSTNSWPRVLGQSESLQSILYFLQVIGRQDFDSSGHCYKTYLKKKTQCFKLVVSLRQQLRSITPSVARLEVIQPAKRFLNSCLEVFNQNVAIFGLQDVQKDRNGLRRRTAIPTINSSVVNSIEQEHEMFSSYVKDLHQYPEIVFSFLESNKPFLHSCHLVTAKTGFTVYVAFVMLVTYTEHGVRLSCSEFWNLTPCVCGEKTIQDLVDKHFQDTRKEADNDHTKVYSASQKGGLMSLVSTAGRF